MPKADRWARLTARLPAETYRRRAALAEEIPGVTPNALVRIAVERLTPQLEAMAGALRAARAGQRSTALELLGALTQAAGSRSSTPVDEAGGAVPADPAAALARVRAL